MTQNNNTNNLLNAYIQKEKNKDKIAENLKTNMK
jgi:hypothetical protein